MRTIVFCFFLLFTVSVMPSLSQAWRATPYQFHIGAGFSNYFGDIGGSASENTWFGIKDLDIVRSRPGIVAGLRYFTGSHFAANGVLTLGWLSGSDTGWRNDARGYAFNTFILEPSIRLEYFPLKDIQAGGGVDRRGMIRNYSTLSAYIFGGIGATGYYTRPNDALKSRQERDGIECGAVSFALPAGVGLKIGINNKTDIGLEIGGRFALNDYIDGLTTDSSTAGDFYYMTSVQLIYRLPGPLINR